MRYLTLSAMILALTAFAAKAADSQDPKFGSAGLLAQAVDASVAKSTRAVATIVITNTSKVTKQLYVTEKPTALDNNGNALFASPGSDGEVGGIYYCNNANSCLSDQKEKTEQNATELDPNQSLTVTLAFPFINKPVDFGDSVSVTLLVHVRNVSVGADSKWKTVSLGVPKIAVRGQ